MFAVVQIFWVFSMCINNMNVQLGISHVEVCDQTFDNFFRPFKYTQQLTRWSPFDKSHLIHATAAKTHKHGATFNIRLKYDQNWKRESSTSEKFSTFLFIQDS